MRRNVLCCALIVLAVAGCRRSKDAPAGAGMPGGIRAAAAPDAVPGPAAGVDVSLAPLAEAGERGALPPVAADGGTTRDAAAGPPSWSLSAVTNVARVGEPTARQRELLESRGFFLAAQPPAPAGAPAGAAAARRATHLFHVYERNDYIRMPSYVTVDLAIDLAHSCFDAVLREVEDRYLSGRLRGTVVELMAEADRVRSSAASPDAKRQATRAVAYWAVALRLLEQPAPGDAPEVEVVPEAWCEECLEQRRLFLAEHPGESPPDECCETPASPPPPTLTSIPGAVERTVAEAVRRVQAAEGTVAVEPLLAAFDLSQARPRGHYTRSGPLQRWFRALTWLGMAYFPVSGPQADPAGVALLARSRLGVPDTARAFDAVAALTAFFAGGPDAATLAAAAGKLLETLPGAASASADALVEPGFLERYAQALAALPAPRIDPGSGGGDAAPQVRVLGRRAFEDAVAMRALLEPAWKAMEWAPDGSLVARLMGAAGAAAALGSDLARDLLADGVADAAAGEILAAVGESRRRLALVPADRWDDDAYHGTLEALRPLLEAPAPDAPALLRSDAWPRRALFAFAGGWAELRHDTILYGEQLGAECDAESFEPPPCWVEPVPVLYARLAAMVRVLDERLRAAGIPVDEQPEDASYSHRPLTEKATAVAELLDFLRETAELELRGELLDADRRERIATIGGEVEWALIMLANTDLLGDREQDMAVVADVFSWRSEPGAPPRPLEVGVAHPDLIYAIIPAPGGPELARGAVMSYRETLLSEGAARLTDEDWRRQVAAGEAPDRPPWVRDLYAEPVPALALPSGLEAQYRCGPGSGNDFGI